MDDRIPVRFPAATEVPINELIAARWSPRAFDPEREVALELLARVFEAARWAPSCFNEQPWDYLVFTGEDPEARERARQTLSEGNAWAGKAPVLAFSVTRKHFARNGKNNRFSSYDVGQATVLAALQAVELGLVFHQMAGYSRKALGEHFPLPEDHVYKAAIAIGYPGDPTTLTEQQREDESRRQPRRPRGDFLHFNGWGG